MSDKTYNILKWIAMTVLPAAITFYGVVGETLNLPRTAIILTIIGAGQVFLCTILGISTENYKRRMMEEEKER